jgi:hypothetical protein
MPNKTRKLRRSHNTHNNKKVADAKKALDPNCKLKSCRASMYQSIYGSVGGNIRSNIGLYR